MKRWSDNEINFLKEYSTKVVIDHLNEFELVNLEYMRIDRNSDLLVTERKKLVF
jgi:hypothetical protein